VLSYTNAVDYELKGLYYEILSLINDREEFGISSMPFSFQQKTPSSKNLEETKHRISEKYQRFLFMSLKGCLENINLKFKEERERNYIVKSLALAYFKIPKVFFD